MLGLKEEKEQEGRGGWTCWSELLQSRNWLHVQVNARNGNTSSTSCMNLRSPR